MSLEQVELEAAGEPFEGRVNVQFPETDAGVVVVPGMGHGPYGDVFDVIAYELAGIGKRVLRFETWDSREALDAKTLAEVQAEVDAAVAHLRSAGCSRVAVLGKSFGGGVVLTHVPDGVERLVLWEPATIELASDPAVEAAPNVEAVRDRPIGEVDEFVLGSAALEAIEVPVRILDGTGEPSVPRAHCERVADAVQDGSVTMVRGEDHSFNRNRRATVGHTLGFLAEPP